jgi:hypothetical protein
MPTAIQISLSGFRDKSWVPPRDRLFIARDPLIPIGMNEAAEAALHLPLAFIPASESFKLVLVAGFDPTQSLLVSADGKWLSAFLPVRVRTHPFTLAPLPSGELCLCLLEEAGALAASGVGKPFFGSDDALTPLVKQIMDLLAATEQGKARAETLATQLFEAGVLRPWEITVSDTTGPRKIEGLMHLDEAKLAALDDESFLKLRRSGALSLAYCQLLSIQNMAGLIQRYNTVKQQQAAAAPAMELDFSGLAR